MSVEIRTMTDSDREAFIALRRSTFRLSSAALEASWGIPVDEVLVAVDGDRLVGSVRSERVGQMVQGSPVPTGLVTAVAVDSGYRSAGIGQALLGEAFAMMRRQSVAITTLHATSPAPYRRAGYEVAGVRSRWQLPLALLANRRPVRATHRIVRAELGDALARATIRETYARFASGHTGLIDRTPEWWDTRVLTGTEECPMDCFLALDETEAVAGYMLLSRLPRTSVVAAGEPDFVFDLFCHDLVWLDVGAAEALLGLLYGHRAVAEVLHWPGPPVDPLATLLADHAPTSVPSFSYLSRIVDVEAAFDERRWAMGIDAELRLRVLDPQVPDNDGCYRITVRDGRGAAERVGSADTVIDIGALSTLYSGAMSVPALHALGRITPGTESTLIELGRVLPLAMPWVMDVF